LVIAGAPSPYCLEFISPLHGISSRCSIFCFYRKCRSGHGKQPLSRRGRRKRDELFRGDERKKPPAFPRAAGEVFYWAFFF
jgi:hypothetical protein